MDRRYRNMEGYADSTAGIAIQRVLKKERKEAMAKRSCRRTLYENYSGCYAEDGLSKVGDMDA